MKPGDGDENIHPLDRASVVILNRARTFWARNQPGVKQSALEPGSFEFYADVERQRYALEPHIPEVVGFSTHRNRRVLEVGCGIGTDGVRLARAGARYVGVDREASALALAERRFELEELPADFQVAAATSLPFDDASFDVVYSHGVIHHIDRTLDAMSEMRRVLRPGGELLVMVYHRRSLNYMVTIMGIRRVLCALLLVPGMARLVARATGESPEILEGHRELLRHYGLRYFKPDLFLNHNTDGPGNPLSKVYTRDGVRRLARSAGLEPVDTQVRYLNLRLYPGGLRLARTRLGQWLERRVGWHLYLRARRR